MTPWAKDGGFNLFPEGVRQVGGTFVVNGNDVVYQWNDRVPGDHPNIDVVMAVAQEAAKSGR